MKLTVNIKRLTDGQLQACVVQDGTRGRNLAGNCAKVLTARTRANTELQKFIEAGYEIEWTGESPDADLKHAADIKKVATKRDQYGL